MSESAEFLAEHINDVPTIILEDLKDVLRQHHSDHPRSKQRNLGPSQIGHPCARHLASTIAGFEPLNASYDPLPSYIGVAVHKRLEEAVALDNSRRQQQGKPQRWLSEHRVDIAPGLSGTADLYDIEQRAVIDLKVPGASAMTGYRRNGPSETYRTQAHLYAYGLTREGREVDRVAIWFLPRGGVLASSVLWSEPYDESVARQAITRLHNLIEVVAELRIEERPEMIKHIPRDNSQCAFCPWFRRKPDGPTACDGAGFDPDHRDRKK